MTSTDEPPSDPEAGSTPELRLAYARLAQERALKERELDQARNSSQRTPWSAPVTTAIVAGALGLAGTLWNSFQNVELERRRQEGTLVLEAIKTGTGQTKLAAANLLFLGNAQLIRLTPDQRTRLEKEAGTDNPLPSLPQEGGRVTFDTSSALTPEVRKRIEQRVDSFQIYLRGIGYQAPNRKVRVFINPDLQANVFYDTDRGRIEVSPALATDTDPILDQLAMGILIEVAGAWVAQLEGVPGSVIWGLSDYFTCSYQDDPILGENFFALTKQQVFDPKRPFLRKLDNDLSFVGPRRVIGQEPHDLGEVWGGTFWDLRQAIGQKAADQLLFAAWSALKQEQVHDKAGRFFLDFVLGADQRLNGGRNSSTISAVFGRHGVKM